MKLQRLKIIDRKNPRNNSTSVIYFMDRQTHRIELD